MKNPVKPISAADLAATIKTKTVAKRPVVLNHGVTSLFKVVIQKPMIAKRKPTERDLAMNRRVVIVSAQDVMQGDEHLRAVLTDADAFFGTTGEIVSVSPTSNAVILCA